MREVRVCSTELLGKSLLRVTVDADHVARVQLVGRLLGDVQRVEVLMSARFNAEHRVVPSVDLVANSGSYARSLEGGWPILVNEGEPARDVPICVGRYLHERVLSPAQRCQHVMLRDYFQWTLHLERPFLDRRRLLV